MSDRVFYFLTGLLIGIILTASGVIVGALLWVF